MACRGVFFALTEEEEAKLLAAPDSDAVIEIITEEIEERWDREWLVEMDKSWDAVHRCLGDGSLRRRQSSLASKAVLGGRQLSSRADWIISYLTAEEVKQVAAAIAALDLLEFRRRYFGLRKAFLWLDRTDYDGPIGEEDFEYSRSYFEEMRLFFSKIAASHRPIIFTVDQ